MKSQKKRKPQEKWNLKKNQISKKKETSRQMKSQKKKGNLKKNEISKKKMKSQKK